MANKKITWKNLIVNYPEDSKATVELDEAIFGVPALEVKRNLNMKETASFISDVVSMCIDEAEAEYTPEFYNFAIRLSVLNHYAGIPLPTGKDGTVQHMMEKAYVVLYTTDLYDKVCSKIDADQFRDMLAAISERIRFNRDLLVSSSAQKLGELLQAVDNMVNEGKNALEQLDGEQFAQALESMAKLGVVERHDVSADETEIHSDNNVVQMHPDAGLEL